MATHLALTQLSGACRDQLEIARQEWGKRIPLTAEALDRALDLGLDVEWAAFRLLHGAARREYDRAYAMALLEHRRQGQSARQEYERVCAAAQRERDRKVEAVWQECKSKSEAARRERDRKIRSAWQEYGRKREAAQRERDRKVEAALLERRRAWGLKLLAILQEIED